MDQHENNGSRDGIPDSSSAQGQESLGDQSSRLPQPNNDN